MAKNKAKSTATWIILGLLFVGLIGFGSTNLSGNVRSIGTVGDEEISIQSYGTAVQQQIQAFEAQTGQTLPFSQYQAMGLDQSVLNQLVGRAVLENEAGQLGIGVRDERVAEQVIAQPGFGGPSDFDRQAYASALERAGLTEAEFEDGLRGDMTRDLLQRSIIAGIPAPEIYAETLVEYLGETRSALWVELSEDDLAEEIPLPNAIEIQTFYSENTNLFLRPEERDITYAALTPDMILDEVEIEADSLRALYDERIDDYVRPERRLVERLVYAGEEDAAAVKARIDAGEIDYDAAVIERGLDLSDVDMGDVTEADLDDAGADIFAASPGDVVGPLPSPFGSALYRVNAVLSAQETTYEEALPDLRAELAAERARRVIDAEVDTLTDLIAGGATIEDLADRSAMELNTITYDETSSEGIAAYAAFRQAAEAAAPGEFAEILELEDGGIFALRIDEVRAPAPIPLAEVRDAAAAAWRGAELKSRLMDRAEELAAEVSEAGAFPEGGPIPQEELDLDRRARVAGTPPVFVTDLFDAAEGEAIVVETPEGAIVALVTGTGQADILSEDERTALLDEAQAGITQDIFDVFLRTLQTRTEVRLDQAAINAVNANFQ